MTTINWHVRFQFQILLNDKLLQSNDSKDAEKFALDHKIANGDNSRDGGNKSCACWPIKERQSQWPKKIPIGCYQRISDDSNVVILLTLYFFFVIKVSFQSAYCCRIYYYCLLSLNNDCHMTAWKVDIFCICRVFREFFTAIWLKSFIIRNVSVWYWFIKYYLLYARVRDVTITVIKIFSENFFVLFALSAMDQLYFQ